MTFREVDRNSLLKYLFSWSRFFLWLWFVLFANSLQKLHNIHAIVWL